MNSIELLKQLVSIPSITPNDGGCLDLIAKTLADFQTEDFNSQTVSNRWFVHGSASPCLVFLGHVDVVPPGLRERWTTDPFIPVEKDGFLHGRGACDMKGGIAAMACACADFVATHPKHRGTIALLLTSDEEGPSIEGTTMALQVLAARGQRFDYGIVGEPTCSQTMGDVIKNGRRGSISAHLTIIGKQGHVAYPHKAKNAIHFFANAMAALTQVRWDDGCNNFPATTMQIANIQAGTGTGNVIPGEMTLDMNWRHGIASSTQSIIERTEALLGTHGLVKDQDYHVRWNVSAKPYLTTATELTNTLRTAVHEITGITPRAETTGGTSDGRFLAEYCDDVVECGTRNATIHQVNERVCIKEVEQLKHIYQRTLETLLA